ncbi:hypothetical protein L580_3497 [Serratia fonticola AU-P3(3)]|nr:hypothetical protein L580_3497 [Serratia fonticola AU-P3(3)]
MKLKLNKEGNYQLLSKVFSRPVVLEIAQKNRMHLLTSILSENFLTRELEDKPVYFIYDEIYKILSKKYRNEYIYKNEIAKKIIRGTHRYSKVSYINEFKINNTIADVAIFNGTSTAYEIKTELDSFERLDSQLSSYQKVFEYVYIVIPPAKLKLAEYSIPNNIGIAILTEKGNIVFHKKAESNINRLSKDWMFKCLRQSEYTCWYEKVRKCPLEGRVAEQKEECFRLFSSLNIELAQKEMVNILKERSLDTYEKEVFKTLPQSLLAALLNLRLNKKSLLNLKDNLRESIC